MPHWSLIIAFITGLFLLMQWPEYGPLHDGLSIGVQHIFIVLPTAIFGVFFGVFYLALYRLQKGLLPASVFLSLLIVSVLSMSSSLLVRINGVLFSPDQRPLSIIREEHYQYLAQTLTAMKAPIRFSAARCGIVQTTQPYWIVRPTAIVGLSGDLLPIEQLAALPPGTPLEIELVPRDQFNRLYDHTVPQECLGAYPLTLTDTNDHLGAIPAIIHLLPATGSGSAL